MQIDNYILDHPLLFAFGLVMLGCAAPFIAGVFTHLLEAL